MNVAARPRVVVIVPGPDGEADVAGLVEDLRADVPGLTVLVRGDGVGNDAVRRAFAEDDAEVYLLLNGAERPDPAAAPLLVRTLLEGRLDQVVGVVDRPGGPGLGHRMLDALVRRLYGETLGDLRSGYRAVSRRFAKSFPATSQGCAVEAELTLHSLSLGLPSASVPVGVTDGAAGGGSRPTPGRDGWRVLRLVCQLVRQERPLAFFGTLAAPALVLAGLLAGLLAGPMTLTAIEGGGAARRMVFFATMCLFLAGLLGLVTGVVADGSRRGRREQSRLLYLAQPAPVPVPRPAPGERPVPRGGHEERLVPVRPPLARREQQPEALAQPGSPVPSPTP